MLLSFVNFYVINNQYWTIIRWEEFVEIHAWGCRNPARISQSNFCPVNTSCIRCNCPHFIPCASSVSGCCARSVAFSGCLQKERTSKAVVLMYYGTSKAAEMRKILGAFYRPISPRAQGWRQKTKARHTTRKRVGPMSSGSCLWSSLLSKMEMMLCCLGLVKALFGGNNPDLHA